MIQTRKDGHLKGTAALLAFSLLAPLCGVAQVGTTALSPTVLYITQGAIKPGKGAALARNRSAVVHALHGAKWIGTSLQLTSITGPEESWTLEFHPDLGDIQVQRERLDATPALRTQLEKLADDESQIYDSKHAVTLLFQENLSYQPKFDWSQARYLDVIAVHVRPGHHPEYLELRGMSRDAHVKGGIDGPLLVYKATSGVVGLEWVMIRPLTSLHQHDDLRAKGFGEPLSPGEDKRMTDLRGASMESAEERFLRIEPKLSLVPETWHSPGESFWAVR